MDALVTNFHGSMRHLDNVNNFKDNHFLSTDKPKDMMEVDVKPCLDDSEENAELDIMISNVVCCFSVRCHLNLREIAMNGSNVEYRRDKGLVKMRLRKPRTLASISSSGKITIIGATSEEEAKKAARRCARSLQKLGFKVRFNNYRIVNVLGTCTMPWAVQINSFSIHYRHVVQYEPEIHPGVIYKLEHSGATIRIFSTGSICVTAPSINAVQAAIEHVYPMVYEFRKKRSAEEQMALETKKRRRLGFAVKDEVIGEEEEEEEDDNLLEDDNSEASDTCLDLP